MSDLKKYIKKRKEKDNKFEENYDIGYKEFKIGAILKVAREKAGLTQGEPSLFPVAHTHTTQHLPYLLNPGLRHVVLTYPETGP